MMCIKKDGGGGGKFNSYFSLTIQEIKNSEKNSWWSNFKVSRNTVHICL